MEVILLRHGQTVGNLLKRYIGRTDEPLCDAGIDTIRRTGVFPSVERVYVSPLLRTRQTAKLLFPNAEQVAVENLKEMDFGDFEGRSAADMENDMEYRAWVEGMCLPACPNGEAVNGFMTRTRAAFEEIVSKEIAYGNKQLIIVGHGGNIMAIMNRHAEPERPIYQWFVKNGCGYRAFLDEATWTDCPEFARFEPLEAQNI